jgi:hypothetical protein
MFVDFYTTLCNLIMKKSLVIISLVAAISILDSCGPSRHAVKEQLVAPVYERPVSPGATYVWVDGDWQWRRGNYVYSNGYWIVPKPNRTYVPGTWVKNHRGYHWKRGYWK